MTAIGAMNAMPIPDAAKAQHLGSLVARDSLSLGERQAAIGVLGNLPGTEAREVLERLIDRLNAGTLPQGLRLDLIEVAREHATLVARVDRLRKAPAETPPFMAFPEALEVGGSATRGRQVVVQHPAAQCTRCHAVGGGALSTVGPRLEGVGKRLSRSEIVQSLLDPNARIAPGFGIVSVTLKNGQKVEGVLKDEDAATVVIAPTEQPDRRISKADIADRSSAASAMPPMGALLQPRQIRDVVEFLAGL
jgi:putative heme-binding domain-containing protein